jgi:hypothetical protein
LLLINHRAYAILPGETGREPGFWDSHSVVYGELASVDEDARPHWKKVKLNCFATLAGSFDCAQVSVLSLSIHHGVAASSVLTVPRPTSRVIVVIQRTKSGEFTVPNHAFDFMPKAAVIVAVKDFEDQVVQTTIKEIRVAQRISRANK